MSSDTAQGGTDEQKAALVDLILRGELTPEEACREHGLSDAELKEWVSAYRRTSRRALEEQLTAQLSARGLPLEDAPISEFTGSLESLALAELIQTIEYGRKDAQIRVDHDGEQGQIWCEQGELIDARSGRLVGSAAVYRLLSLRHGRVYAHFTRVERTRTIHASTPAVLLESAKRYDECRLLRERIGDSSAIYVVSPNAWAAEARLEPDTWQRLRAFDGASSVDAVVAASSMPELETLGAISSLLEQQLLIAKPPPTSPQFLPIATEAGEQLKPESSFLPLAASLRARLTQPGPQRRRLWLSAVAGACVVVAAFGVGFWSVRREAAPGRPPGAVAASANEWANHEGCPDGLALMAGGPLFSHGPLEADAPSRNDSSEPRIAAFCLGRRETTVAEFEACVAASGCEPAEREYDLRRVHPEPADSREPAGVALQCNSGQAGRERHPINCVNFQQAQQFCAWRGGRLPTQSEWEYAAQEVRPEPGEGHQGTLPVGSFPGGGNPEGVLDLFGNVSEWTTGRVGQRSADAEDPARNQLYVVLGGGLHAGASRLGARASRLYMNANARGRSVGFRCALGVPSGS